MQTAGAVNDDPDRVGAPLPERTGRFPSRDDTRTGHRAPLTNVTGGPDSHDEELCFHWVFWQAIWPSNGNQPCALCVQ